MREVLDAIPDRRAELERARQLIAERSTGNLAPNRKTIAVLGDSHAVDFGLALQLTLGDDKANVVLLHHLCDPLSRDSITIPIPQLYERHGQDQTRVPGFCENFHDEFIQMILGAKPDIVVFSEAWRPETLPYVKRTMESVKAATQARILIMGRVPELSGNPDVTFRAMPTFDSINESAWGRRSRIFDDFDARLKAIAEETGVAFISKTEAVCPNLVCEIMIGTELGYTDTQHWTVAGMEHYGRRMVETPVFRRLLAE
ncbi:SGNH hydrolase domain-containing protein [Hyphomonas sp.]|uniref:SGNH hydrolase domain-containing protein n=1 Tax=Hyphomonas sp. TaxID=87 RepID=UPI0039193740